MADETHIILLHGDTDFTVKERRLIQEASDAWYRFTRGRFLFHVEFDLHKSDLDLPIQDDLIYRVSSKFYYVADYNKAHKTSIWGLCTFRQPHQSIIYMVVENLHSGHDFRTTMMHELGHYVGLGHTEKNSIMHAYFTTVPYFTQIDAEELGKKYGYTLDELNYD